jgi:acyl-ACP thioesterase
LVQRRRRHRRGQAQVAGRRQGGRIEVDSVWIHLNAEQRPARIGDFGVYAETAAGRRVSTKLELPDPPRAGRRLRWPLRATDIDRHGHVNNAVYWQAVEHLLPSLGLDPERPFRADLDYRGPIDLGEEVELVAFEKAGRPGVGFITGDAVKAVALLGQAGPLPGRATCP